MFNFVVVSVERHNQEMFPGGIGWKARKGYVLED